VFASQADPYVWASYVFSWYTGVAIELTLFSPWTLPPGHFQGSVLNGTVWHQVNATSFAGEPVGTNLGLDGEPIGPTFELNETNIDLTAQTVPDPAATDAGIWGYLPYAIAAFVGLAIAFVIVRRRKKQIRTASTASFSNSAG
jgi:hypothetical protein